MIILTCFGKMLSVRQHWSSLIYLLEDQIQVTLQREVYMYFDVVHDMCVVYILLEKHKKESNIWNT